MKSGDLVKHKTFNDKNYSVGYILSKWENECLIRWKDGQILLHDMDFVEVLQPVSSLG